MQPDEIAHDLTMLYLQLMFQYSLNKNTDLDEYSPHHLVNQYKDLKKRISEELKLP